MEKEIILEWALSKIEVDELTRRLKKRGVRSFYKESGYGNLERIKYGRNRIDRHILIIDENDRILALEVLEVFKKKRSNDLKIRNSTCPKCGSSMPKVSLKKLNLFQKLIYIGTTPMVCAKCNAEWY